MTVEKAPGAHLAPIARTILLTVLLLGLVPSPVGAAEEWFDALLARVNGEPMLVSDVNIHEALFRSGESFTRMTPLHREIAVEGLIRYQMLLAEAKRFGVAHPDEADVMRSAASLQKKIGPRIGWIDAEIVVEKIRERLWVDAFIDARIRAFVMIREIRVTGELQSTGGPRPGESDTDAQERVRERLTDQEVDGRLKRYLDRLVKRAEISRYPLPGSAFVTD